MSPTMAGGELGAPTRRTAGSAGAAGVVAEGRTILESSCAAKTKTGEAEASGCAAMAAAAVAKAENNKAAGENDETPPAAKNRMSEREIRWFLARKPSAGPSQYRALKERNPDLTPLPGEEMDESKKNLYFMTREFYRMEEEYPKMQAWIRHELETKGYVELDDDWVRRRAQAKATLEEGWKEIEAMFPSETSEDGVDDDEESSSDDDDK